jgi:hypothetical protein
LQSKLSFERYIDCPEQTNDTLPGLEGLPVRSKKVKLNDFIVHQVGGKRARGGDRGRRREG